MYSVRRHASRHAANEVHLIYGVHLEDTGVVDQNVETAEFSHRLRHQSLTELGVTDVPGEALVRSSPQKRRQGLLRSLLVTQITQRHLCATLGKAFSDGPADASSAAGDEDAFAGEVHTLDFTPLPVPNRHNAEASSLVSGWLERFRIRGGK